MDALTVLKTVIISKQQQRVYKSNIRIAVHGEVRTIEKTGSLN